MKEGDPSERALELSFLHSLPGCWAGQWPLILWALPPGWGEGGRSPGSSACPPAPEPLFCGWGPQPPGYSLQASDDWASSLELGGMRKAAARGHQDCLGAADAPSLGWSSFLTGCRRCCRVPPRRLSAAFCPSGPRTCSSAVGGQPGWACCSWLPPGVTHCPGLPASDGNQP